jgi:hypothetical protein
MEKEKNDGRERTNKKLARRSPETDSKCQKFSKTKYLFLCRGRGSAYTSINNRAPESRF